MQPGPDCGIFTVDRFHDCCDTYGFSFAVDGSFNSRMEQGMQCGCMGQMVDGFDACCDTTGFANAT